MTVTDSLAYSKEYSLICLIFHPNKLRMNRLLQNPVTLNMATFITQHTRNDEKISNFALILVKKTNTKHIMTPKEIRNQRLAEKMLKNLKRRNFEAIYCPTAAEAVERVSAMIPDGSSVSWGGSMTIRDMGLTEALHKRDLRLLDRDLAADRDEAQRIYREAFSADFYLTSANAISEDGVVVNIDGNGNRVAAITFGPKKVILVVGLNKVAQDVNAALARARSTASPINAARFDIKTPCQVDGVCHNCNSPESICNYIHFMRNSHPAGRHTVVLVGEDLGY